MEKKIVITMSVDEAKGFKYNLEGFEVLLKKMEELIVDSEPESQERTIKLMALVGHKRRLETLMEVFDTS